MTEQEYIAAGDLEKMRTISRTIGQLNGEYENLELVLRFSLAAESRLLEKLQKMMHEPSTPVEKEQ